MNVDSTAVRRRRWGALAVLVVAFAVVFTTVNQSVPRDQMVTVRLPERPDARATLLSMYFTPVGEREPLRGVSVAVDSASPRRIRQRMRLPNGDYIVSLELTWAHRAGPSAPEFTETSHARRVTLSGDETFVTFEAEGSD